MVLGFSGWMDGGEVSTGTTEYLVHQLEASEFAHIEPDDFYIYNFPGTMEFSSLFRPRISIRDGLIVDYHEPTNAFFADPANNLILFSGEEPNLKWHEYTDCILSIVDEFDVKEIYFIGSVAGLVPHTREPRFTSTVSNLKLKTLLAEHNITFTNYQGPGSITTNLLMAARARKINMVSIVAEIPAYVQGRNPKCIEAVIKRLAGFLKLEISLDELRDVADEMEKKLNELIEDRSELAAHIIKLEENYDKALFDSDMGDLKQWLEGQGIRLD